MGRLAVAIGCIIVIAAGGILNLLFTSSLCNDMLSQIEISRRQVEQLILQYRPTLLFVEHDRAFCRAVATRTLPLGGA